MRQVFSSPRLQNVEGVAALLREAGIEVRITDGRSYRSGWSGRRSYRDDAGATPQAAVWVVKSEEQPRARALLRDAGLLHDTTMPTDSYVPDAATAPGARGLLGGGGRATRYKVILLAAIAVVVALAFIRGTGPGSVPLAADVPADTPAPPAALPPPMPAPLPDRPWRVDVPTALAEVLARQALAGAAGDPGCLRVDGTVADAPLRARLASSGLRLASGCEGAPLRVDVHDYRTDGSGAGRVRVDVTRDGSTSTGEYEVRREGDTWDVLPATAEP